MRACRVGTVLVFKCGARAVVRVERSAWRAARPARSLRGRDSPAPRAPQPVRLSARAAQCGASRAERYSGHVVV